MLVSLFQFIASFGSLKSFLVGQGIINSNSIVFNKVEDIKISDKFAPSMDVQISDSEYYVDHAVIIVRSRENLFFQNTSYNFKPCKKYETYYEVVLPLDQTGVQDVGLKVTDIFGNVVLSNHKLNRVVKYDQSINLGYIEPYLNSSIICNEDLFTVVIDEEHRLSAGYVPSDLIDITSLGVKSNNGGLLRHEAAYKYKEMQDALNAAGINVTVSSAYRPFQQQEYTYNYISAYQGINQAQSLAARPGYSEHQLGLAVDIVNEETHYQLPSGDGNTRLYNWVRENSYRYGFVQTYDGSENGIRNEIWHLRYVGVDAAKEIYNNKVNPLEYLRNINGLNG